MFVIVDRILADRIGRAIEGMQFARFVVPSVHHVLARMNLVHQLVSIGCAVIDAALHDDRRVAALDGRPVVLVLMRQVAPRDIFAMALAVFVDADVQAHAPEHAEVGIGMLGAFVQPGEEVVVGLDLLVALEGAA